MIGSIGSYRSGNSLGGYGIYTNYNMMTNLRLLQSLNQRQNAVSPVNRVGAGLGSEAASFLKQYQGSMTKLMEAANKLRDNGSAAKTALRASSSDSAVAKVSSAVQNHEGRYTLKVEQLASGQTNRTQGMENSAQPSLGGSLTLKTGAGTFQFYLSAAGQKDVKSALESYAGEINSRDTGVNATVVQNEDDTYSLQLAGAETGAFTVLGSFAERTGLDQVATTAKQAVFTVQAEGEEAQSFTSDTNRIEIDGIDVTLTGTGSTELHITRQSGLTADAVQELVDAFNSSLTLLNDNAERGVGVLRQMKRMVQPPAAERSLNLVGITIGRDGTLRLDKEAFETALRESPSLTREIISGSSGLAQGIYTDGQQGLRVSSASLLSTQLQQSQLDSLQNPLNTMALYSKSGAFNLLNFYAVGALMNMNI